MLRTLLVVLPAAASAADVISVPGDHDTIQAAITAAADGDEIVVSPGTYAESFSYVGKSVTVRSAAGPLVTIIDGESLANALVLVINGEAATLEGFSLFNGEGSPFTSCELGFNNGGAVYVGSGSSLTVVDCRFENNAFDTDTTAGGAIAVYNGALSIHDSVFLHNGNYDTDDDLATAYGGAVYLCNPSFPGSLTIDNCHFESNGTAAHGGAIMVNTDADVTITNSQFFDNSASHGGGINCRAAGAPFQTLIEGCLFVGGFSSFGGGLNLQGGAATVRDCEFVDNAAGFGGGLLVNGNSGSFVLDRLRFENNRAEHTLNVGNFHEPCWIDGNQADYRGGGADLRISNGTISLSNVLTVGNAAAFGGGIAASICGGGDFTISNLSATANEPSGVHIRLSEQPGFPGANMLSMSNAILWDNAGTGQIILEEVFGDDLTFALDHSIVQGGFEGDGVIDRDPMFTQELALAAGSPAIDAGNNGAVDAASDLAGNARFVDDPDTEDTGIGPAPIVDMGAFEFQGGCAADVNADGALNVLDFVAFQLLWQANDPAADCDADGEFNVLDFVCFQLLFEQGC